MSNNIVKFPNLPQKFGSAWTPDFITTKAWWDFSEEPLVLGSSYRVTDKSGNGRLLEESNVSYHPSFTGSINGRPATNFGGTARLGFSPSVGALFPPNDNSVVLAVVEGTAGDEDFVLYFGSTAGDGNGSGSNLMECHMGIQLATREVKTFIQDGANPDSIAIATVGADSVNPCLIGSAFIRPAPIAPTAIAWKNGDYANRVENQDGFNSAGYAASFGFVGANGSTSAQLERWFSGNIGEIIIFDGDALDAAEKRVKLEGYLAWRWGLQDNLPADHLYKTHRPVREGF